MRAAQSSWGKGATICIRFPERQPIEYHGLNNTFKILLFGALYNTLICFYLMLIMKT